MRRFLFLIVLALPLFGDTPLVPPLANPIEPPRRRSEIEFAHAPATSGPLVFHATRIPDPPYFGAKRIALIDAPR